MSNEGQPDDRKKIKDRQEKFLRLKDQRTQSIESVAMDVTRYFVPWLGRYPGDDMKPDQLHGRRMDRILDSTTTDAWEIAQNGMNSGLTPSSRPWFAIEYHDDGLNKYGPSRDWLDKLTKVVYQLLRQGGFYPAMHATYGEILAFATGCISAMRYPDTGRFYKDLTFGEYWISSSSGNKIDTVFRSWWMTARQIVQYFGKSNVSKQVAKDADKNPYNCYEVIHCVQPRKGHNPDKIDSRNLPFESVWWENMTTSDIAVQHSFQESTSPTLLRESGFKRLPYYIPRWKVTGSDMYGGASPCIRKLGDAKVLQDMEESGVIAIHKELDPPIMADKRYRGIDIRTGAGGINYVDMQNAAQGQLQPLYNTKFNIPAADGKQQQIRTRIKDGLFNNLFLMLLNLQSQADRVTARQIDQMTSQGLLQLGPFIEHMEEGVLNNVIIDAVDEVLEFPEFYGIEKPPQEAQGQQFKIIYISMLAQAQRAVGKAAIDEMIAVVGNAMTVFPEAADLVSIDDALRERADLTGVPSRMMRSEEIVQAIRNKRQEEQQKKEQMEQAQALVEGANKLGKTPMVPEKPSALTAMATAFNQ